MSRSIKNKVKHLYQLLPPNVVISASWLENQNISMQLRYKYVKNGWLHTLGKGAYIINPNLYTWQGLVVGIQRYMKLPYHIGGLTALNIQGFSHYLPIGNETRITLYGLKNFPAWLKNIEIPDTLFLYKKPDLKNIGLKQYPSDLKDQPITISTPERAIFELLYLIEKQGVNFEFAGEIFEGLTTLRPDLINHLLNQCESKRVKRLFLFFMDYTNHPWKPFIKPELVELGSGKMQIVKGGSLDKKYLITVPGEFINGSE